MLKLKLQHFGHVVRKADSLEKTLMLGKIEGRRRRGRQRMRGWMASLTQWTWVWACSGSWWWTGKPGVLQWGHKESETPEWLNWTDCFKHGILKSLEERPWVVDGESHQWDSWCAHGLRAGWHACVSLEPALPPVLELWLCPLLAVCGWTFSFCTTNICTVILYLFICED